MRAVVAVVVLMLAGCATRIHGGVYSDDGGGELDLSTVADLAPPADQSLPPADLNPGKSCGDIMKCMFGCGLQLGACQLMCFQGASPKGAQEAAALLGCAAQKCLLTDGGSLPVCLFNNCGTQIMNCEGFGFGG